MGFWAKTQLGLAMTLDSSFDSGFFLKGTGKNLDSTWLLFKQILKANDLIDFV